MDYAFAVKFFGGLFAIMNPFANLPVFLAMTVHRSVAEQRQLALKTVLYSAVMCAIIAIGGKQIIAFFGITVEHFRIAGGLVLASIAFSMLSGKELTGHSHADPGKPAPQPDDTISFYPMTFPIIVGPGTIATLIIYISQAEGPTQYVAYGTVVIGILAILLAVLYFASAIGHVLSAKMRVIVTRVMGMILVAIAVEMITSGLKSVLPGLA